MQDRKTVPVHLLEIMVSLGGGVWKGLQDGFFNKFNQWVEPLAMFNSPATGTTLALPISKVSAHVVRKHIAKSDEQFQVYAEKACTRVLGQFGEGA